MSSRQMCESSTTSTETFLPMWLPYPVCGAGSIPKRGGPSPGESSQEPAHHVHQVLTHQVTLGDVAVRPGGQPALPVLLPPTGGEDDDGQALQGRVGFE